MPRHANAGRRELFLTYVRSRLAVWSYFLGCCGSFLYGAYRHDLLIMATAPAAVAVLVTLAAAVAADRAAEERFFATLARSLGLSYVGRTTLLALTPLLGAGDRRWCEHWMQGVVSREHRLSGGLGHFVYEVRRGARGAGGVRHELTLERHALTICAAEIEPAMTRFKGVFLRPRRGIFDGEDWVQAPGMRTVELESATFCDRYELLISDDQGEVATRELLSPSLVDWLARHPLVPCFELKAGTLVVFVARRLEDAGSLQLFLDAARHLSARVLEELAEAAVRPHPGGNQSAWPSRTSIRPSS